MEAEATSVSSEARKGNNDILRIEAWRVGTGLRVRLEGGREVRELLRKVSELEGRPDPVVHHGIPCWQSHRLVEIQTGIRLVAPATPTLGIWILRASNIGQNPDGYEFDLPSPHRTKFVEDMVAQITHTATAIYREFLRAMRIKQIAVAVDPLPDNTWQQLVTGGFALDPTLDRQLTAELQRMLRQANQYR